MAISRTGNSNQMWGGRFEGGPAAVMREINASIATDKRLWREDIAASRAHAAMLGRRGILSEADAKAIDEGLAAVGLEIGEGKLVEDPALTSTGLPPSTARASPSSHVRTRSCADSMWSCTPSRNSSPPQRPIQSRSPRHLARALSTKAISA